MYAKLEKFTARAEPPPVIFWDRRRSSADQNWPARRRRHNDVGAELYTRETADVS